MGAGMKATLWILAFFGFIAIVVLSMFFAPPWVLLTILGSLLLFCIINLWRSLRDYYRLTAPRPKS